MRISCTETFPISFLISEGPAAFRVSSGNVVVTAIHLQAAKKNRNLINQQQGEKKQTTEGIRGTQMTSL